MRSVHFNLFDRNADGEEVAFWRGPLDEGLDAAGLPAELLAPARGSDVEALRARSSSPSTSLAKPRSGATSPTPSPSPRCAANAELYPDLDSLGAQYDTLSLEAIGQSPNGNPLHASTVGTGKTRLLFVTQQHGDEPIGTEAAMFLLDVLAEDKEAARTLREEVTVTVVPRVNPDGFARWEREVGGERGLIDPRLNDSEIDLNRTYHPAAPFGADVAPGSVAIRELAARLDPAVLFD